MKATVSVNEGYVSRNRKQVFERVKSVCQLRRDEINSTEFFSLKCVKPISNCCHRRGTAHLKKGMDIMVDCSYCVYIYIHTLFMLQ